MVLVADGAGVVVLGSWIVTEGRIGVLLSSVLSWVCGEARGGRHGWVEDNGGRFRGGRRGCVEKAGVANRLTGGRLMLMGGRDDGVVNPVM